MPKFFLKANFHVKFLQEHQYSHFQAQLLIFQHIDRIEVEKSMSNIDNRVTKLDHFLFNKFGHKYVFNGWISDLTAVISKV